MSKTFQAGHHYKELDSLRGLAAITVLNGHYLNLFKVKQGPFVELGEKVELAHKTPLFALMAGHESVMLFFVLSGFVLSLPFLNGRTVNYGSYAIRRTFRIYVPYLAALALALICNVLIYRGPIPDLSEWFNTPWSAGVTSSSVIGHLTFLGSFKSDSFDPVLWSLVQEMRISLLFPVLAALLLRLRWKTNIALSLVLSFVGITATLWLTKLKVDSDYFLTIHYAAIFIFGFLLAQNINVISAWYSRRSFAQRLGLALFGFSLYTFAQQLPGRLKYFEDLPIAVGAVLLVITGVCSTRTSAFLNAPLVRFFGDVSYSLYLYHAIMVLAFTHVLYGRLPIEAILGLAAAVSVLVSYLSYTYVERPAIKLGRTVSARWEGKTYPVKSAGSKA